ncbi:MAG: hypothetical protein AAGU27_26400 [Dehalobacterium sp.]|uniref:hypothetical protein n=1 Tax=Desulfitobacterium hafniense TaxID=49338 RepID=UPI000373BE83|nr:hypothetical protein [Desulfitobacterium hafniense]
MKRVLLSILLLMISFFLSIKAVEFENYYDVSIVAYLVTCLLYLLVLCGIYGALYPLFQNYKEKERYLLTGVFSVFLFVVFRYFLTYLGLIFLSPIL